MLTTANYGLKKPEGTDVVDIQDFNDNADIIDTQIKNLNNNLAGIVAKGIDYAVASGTNSYTATISDATLIEGRSYKIKFTNANTGASTLNINSLGAKTIQKSNGNALASGNIKAGQILHLVYTGSVFQLLGEGGEYGTATENQTLQGYTIGTEIGIKNGTIKKHTTSENRITASMMIDGASTEGALYVKPEEGWFDGLDGWVQVSDPNFKKENILEGVNVLGKVGTMKRGKKFLEIALNYTGGDLILSGLDFIPSKAIIFRTDNIFQWLQILTRTNEFKYSSWNYYGMLFHGGAGQTQAKSVDTNMLTNDGFIIPSSFGNMFGNNPCTFRCYIYE